MTCHPHAIADAGAVLEFLLVSGPDPEDVARLSSGAWTEIASLVPVNTLSRETRRLVVDAYRQVASVSRHSCCASCDGTGIVETGKN